MVVVTSQLSSPVPLGAGQGQLAEHGFERKIQACPPPLGSQAHEQLLAHAASVVVVLQLQDGSVVVVVVVSQLTTLATDPVAQ